MRKSLYEAFTLVEMLIVMGILIILMVIGITAGRFAINRANDVAHQNAVDQIYQGLQAYYTDNRDFPDATTVEALIGEVGDESAPLNKYLDSGAFKGGTEAEFYYFVETAQKQSVLVCVTLGGEDDARQRGVYCNGNGFGDEDLTIGAGTGNVTGANVTDKSIPYTTGDGAATYNAIIAADGSVWNGSSWGSAEPAVEGE